MGKYFLPYTEECFIENAEQSLRHLQRAINSLEKNEAAFNNDSYGIPWHPTWCKLKEAKGLLTDAVRKHKPGEQDKVERGSEKDDGEHWAGVKG